LANDFYRHFGEEWERWERERLQGSQRDENLISLGWSASWRTAGDVLNGGPLTILTALIGLVASARSLKGNYGCLLVYFLIPIVASCYIWVLLRIMESASIFLGSALRGIAIVVGSSIGIPVIGWLLLGALREREHHITGSIIAWILKKK
jgi:hypothetical protein